MGNDINKRVVMITTMLGSFLTPFMGSSVVVALPSIGKEFALNAGLINWIATSFILTTAVFVVPCGKFADIYGRKKILFYGLSIFTLSAIFCGVSTNAFMLISFRTLQGIGGAMISATVIAIITSVYSPGERGKAIGINVAATYAVSFLLSLYLQYIKGFNPEQAGLILVVQPAVQALFSPLSVKLSDRVESQKVASFGMGLSTIGLLISCFLKIDTNVFIIFITLVILGFGFALFSSPNTNAVMNSVEKRYYGVASGILGAARTIGQTVSMGITSLILTLFWGNTTINNSNNSGFIHGIRVSFVVFTIMCFWGIFASLARGKVEDKNEIV